MRFFWGEGGHFSRFRWFSSHRFVSAPVCVVTPQRPYVCTIEEYFIQLLTLKYCAIMEFVGPVRAGRRDFTAEMGCSIPSYNKSTPHKLSMFNALGKPEERPRFGPVE